MDVMNKMNCTFSSSGCVADFLPTAKAAYADLFRCGRQHYKHLSLIRCLVPLAGLLRLRTYALGSCRVGEMNPTPAVAMLMPQAMVGCLQGIFKTSFVSSSCSKA